MYNYEQVNKHKEVLYYRKDFRSLRGTPGNILEPQVHPVVWLQKDAVSKVRPCPDIFKNVFKGIKGVCCQ